MIKILLSLLLITSLCRAASTSDYDFPLGPIGGTFRISTGENYARVTAITPGGAGDFAGLQVGDYIFGTDGIDFNETGADFQGVTRELGWAIGQAQATDGILSLNVLRSGAGSIVVNVDLGTAGGFSPAYPLNSPTFAKVAEESLDALNTRLENSSNVGYTTAFAGLSLLASPHWNDTTGDHPYRNGIETVYAYTKDQIERALYAPLEEKFFDGTDNPNYDSTSVIYLENWYLGAGTMFLAEYYSKTLESPPTQKNIEDLALVQMAAEKCANRIQWWRQPQTRGSGQYYTSLRPGIIGHIGAIGDYMHYSWGGGINIVGVHISGGLAMAKQAGVDMSVRPIDGRYFGYDPLLFDGDPSNDPAGESLPAGLNYDHANNTVQVRVGVNGDGSPIWEAKKFIPDTSSHPDIPNVASFATQQPTLEDKLNIVWDFYKRSQTTSSGHINYLVGSGELVDSGGRTPGALFTSYMMQRNSTAFTGNDLTRYDLLKGYFVNHYDRHLNSHATNVQGPVFYALSAGALDPKERRYHFDNWRFLYELSRNADDTTTFFRGRSYGGSGEAGQADEIYFGLANGAAAGGLNLTDGFDTANQRLVDFKKMAHHSWPSIAKRNITTKQASLDMDLDVTDGAGVPVTGYTAQWTTSSAATFSDANTLNTTINFPRSGFYDVDLTITHGGITSVEPIRIFAESTIDTDLYRPNRVFARIYTDVPGDTLEDLYASPKWPDNHDSRFALKTMENRWNGDNLGVSLITTIVPEVTGTYRFYLAADEVGTLLFNPNGPFATGAMEIASVSQATGSEEWNNDPSQQSVEFTLTAGQHYYIEARMKDGTGTQVLQVGWTRPDNANIEIIGEEFMAAPLDDAPDPPAFTTQPQGTTLDLGDPLSLSAEVVGAEPRSFQWYLNGEKFGEVLQTPTLDISNASAYVAGDWHLVYTSKDAVLTSDTVTVNVNGVGQIVNGGLWQEVYNGLNGNDISTLTGSSKYPQSPDSSGPITVSYTGSIGDSYGQRWTGWIVPSETARYRFYAAADDQFVLNFSETEYACHATEILRINNATYERNFTGIGPSAWMELTAGQRYYVEVLQKEGGGGDHAALAWQKEGDPAPATGSEGIPSANLQYRTGGPDSAQACPVLARADAGSAVRGGPSVDIPVLDNDYVSDGNTLTISNVGTPTSGTAVLAANGTSITYTPAADSLGQQSFTYQITGTDGTTSTATVTMTVQLLGGLLLHYDFEDAAQDSSGNNRHGSFTSGVTTDPEHGTVMVVGAGNHRVNVDPSVTSAMTRSASISYWAKATSFTSSISDYLAASSANGSRVLRWHYPWAGTMIMDWGTGLSTDDYDRVNGPGGLDSNTLLNRWNHIVLTKDTDSGELSIYSDGQLAVTATGQTRELGIATSFNFGGSNFRGQLNDFCIYDRALTQAEVTLLYDRFSQPMVSLAVAPDSAAENSGATFTYTLMRTGATDDALPVMLAIAGTATSGSDYQAISSMVTIPAGQSSKTFATQPIDDALVENAETIEVTITPSSEYTVSSQASAAVILNDDWPAKGAPEVTVDKINGTVATRLTVGDEVSKATLQWSTSLINGEWTDTTPQPVELTGEMLTMPIPAGKENAPELFFRWKVE